MMKQNFLILILSIFILAGMSVVMVFKEKALLGYYVLRNDFTLPMPQKASLTVENPSDNQWLHSVNQLEKLEHALHKYSGIEADLYYDTLNRNFQIRHWPDTAIEDLTLQNFLSYIRNQDKTPFIWLDFKNLQFLSYPYINQSALILDSIIASTGTKKAQLIIESQSPEALKIFIDVGYECSLWVPTFKANLISKRDVLQWERSLRTTINKYNISRMSAPVEMLPYVTTYFPDIKHMVWGVSSNLEVLLIDDRL